MKIILQPTVFDYTEIEILGDLDRLQFCDIVVKKW